MKQTTKTFATIVLLAGIAVIFAGFFLLVPEEKRNEIFWLDLIVTCFVFTISCVIELGLIANSAFDKAVGKGVIHKNKANRMKSRLAKRAHAATK